MPGVIQTPETNFRDLAGYPFAPHFLPVRVGGLDLQMHYLDEAPPGSVDAPVVLMVHGMPTWSYLYRHMVAPLVAAGYRCIAMDHIGFGRSDKVTADNWYSIARHTEALGQFIQALDLQRITLVVQDWGGPTGLAQAVAMPARFDRLVVLNTWLHHAGYTYSPGIERWNAMWHDGGLFADDHPVGAIVLNTLGGVDRRSLIEGRPEALPGFEDALAGYNAPFAGLGNEAFAGVRRFPLSLPFDNPVGGHAEGQELHWHALGHWTKPMHFIWGVEDTVFTPEWGREWAARHPQASFDAIEGANHFLQESHGTKIAEHLLQRMGEAPA